MERIKFSFVILTWNRSFFLSLCVEKLLLSIKNTNNIEIIIVDNGSTDDTELVLNEFQKKPWFKIFRMKKNYNLNSYKKLFRTAKGEFIITIDEDVLDFPKDFAEAFEMYFKKFSDYAYLALDVLKNEFTNGAKPDDSNYIEDIRYGLTVQRGPTGGWCACFKRKDFNKIKFFFYLINLSMRRSEDAVLSFLFKTFLHKKIGILKGVTCFHACGPYYAKQYGYLAAQTEKYRIAGLNTIYNAYKQYE